MPAGTITLTNGSTAVTGSGTAFTTDVAVNGFIVASVGGTAYTLGISAITSDTALTLTQAYTGPTTSGVSFDYVPLAMLNLITSALASQVTYAIRGLNLDKANWQQIFTGTGNVTVTLPDGTTWTGPAWNGIIDLLNEKVDSSDLDDYAKNGANSDITSLSGLTTALSIEQGGTGAKTADAGLSALGGYPKSGGALSGAISFSAATDARQTLLNMGVQGTNVRLVIPISTTQGLMIITSAAAPTSNAAGEGTVSFPVSFASAPASVVVSNGNGAALTAGDIQVINTPGAGGFDFRLRNFSGAVIANTTVQINYTVMGIVNL